MVERRHDDRYRRVQVWWNVGTVTGIAEYTYGGI